MYLGDRAMWACPKIKIDITSQPECGAMTTTQDAKIIVKTLVKERIAPPTVTK